MDLRAARLLPRVTVPVPLLALACGLLVGTTLVLIAGQTSPLLAAGVMAGLIVAGAVMLFPELGFMLTALVIPLERVGRFTDDSAVHTISVGRFVGLLALGAFLLHALIRRWQLRFGLGLALYLGYFGFGVITVFFSNDWDDGVRTASQVAGVLIFLFFVINIVHSWRLAKLGVVLWLVASLTTGIWTAVSWHFSLFDDVIGEQNVGTTSRRLASVMDDNSPWDRLEGVVKRAQGTTSHPAVYGINMVMTLPFWFFLLRTQRSRVLRIGVALSLLVCVYSVFLTNTRAAIVLAAVIILLAAVRGLVRLTPGGLVALAIVGCSMLPLVPNDVWVRVLDVSRYAAGQNSGTLDLRFQFWDAAVRGIQRSIWVGNGLGNQLVVPELVRGVSVTRISAHNEYINTLMEVGVIGWVLMFGAIYVLVRSSFRAAAIFRRLPGRSEQYWFMVAAQLTLLSALFYGVQVDVFHFPLKGWWFVAGLSWAMELLAREEAAAAAATAPAAAR